jgi:magnesium-transporting ATPase (P-type)
VEKERKEKKPPSSFCEEKSFSRSLLLFSAFFGIFFLLLHLFFQYTYSYWIFPSLDIPMHFLGGVWTAVFFVYFVKYSRFSSFFPFFYKSSPSFVALLGSFSIGFLWEIYQWIVKYITHFPLGLPYFYDTLLDIGMDVLGGACVALFFYLKKRKEK